jgi:hypothetical protein
MRGMTSLRTPQDHRRFAVMAAVAGVVFLIVGFGKAWDWRGIVSTATGVLWLIADVPHLRRARSEEPPSQAYA